MLSTNWENFIVLEVCLLSIPSVFVVIHILCW